MSPRSRETPWLFWVVFAAAHVGAVLLMLGFSVVATLVDRLR